MTMASKIKVTVLLLNGNLLVVYGKPIISSQLIGRQFVLFSKAIYERGLDAVLYGVVEVRSGACLGYGNTKAAALQLARESFSEVSKETMERCFLMQEERMREAVEAFERQVAANKVQITRTPARIGKRRQSIFDKSEGKCHYCAIALKVESGWHIEHMTPRSRGGTDLMDNLVAACAPCNRKKHSKTADEFKPMALVKQMGVKG